MMEEEEIVVPAEDAAMPEVVVEETGDKSSGGWKEEDLTETTATTATDESDFAVNQQHQPATTVIRRGLRRTLEERQAKEKQRLLSSSQLVVKPGAAKIGGKQQSKDASDLKSDDPAAAAGGHDDHDDVTPRDDGTQEQELVSEQPEDGLMTSDEATSDGSKAVQPFQRGLRRHSADVAAKQQARASLLSIAGGKSSSTLLAGSSSSLTTSPSHQSPGLRRTSLLARRNSLQEALQGKMLSVNAGSIRTIRTDHKSTASPSESDLLSLTTGNLVHADDQSIPNVASVGPEDASNSNKDKVGIKLSDATAKSLPEDKKCMPVSSMVEKKQDDPQQEPEDEEPVPLPVLQWNVSLPEPLPLQRADRNDENNPFRSHVPQPGAVSVDPGILVSRPRDNQQANRSTEVAAAAPSTVPNLSDAEDAVFRGNGSDDGLVEATLMRNAIRSSQFMYAEEIDQEAMLQQRRAKESKEKQYCRVGMAIAGLAILILVIGLAFVLSGRGKDTTTLLSSDTPSNAPSESPSNAPTGSLDLFVQGLPNFTQDSLNTVSSPQWQALAWLQDHPELPTMPEWRKTQLFALATFFYSFAGPSWREEMRSDWMLYDKSECVWFSTIYGYFEEEEFVPNYWGFNANQCDQEGKLQLLALQNLQMRTGQEPVLPLEIVLLTSLKNLAIEGYINASLQELVPLEFYSMGIPPSLITLSLRGTRTQGSIPSEVGLLTTLQELFLQASWLSGTLPTQVGLLTNLGYLNLQWNDLSGSLPSELGELTDMHRLLVAGSNLNGSLPTELGLLTKLTRLELHNNTLSGSIPTELGQTKIRHLQLFNNSLTGRIPSELGLLTSMTDIAMSSNALSGAIPSELGQWSNVTVMYVHNNTLFSNIPSQLGLLSNLTILFAFNNSLSGVVPSQLGMMSSMQQLAFLDNELSGTIPSELGQLTNMMMLWLSNNTLTGTIPQEVGNLVVTGTLYGFFAEYNDLSGVVPEPLCFLGPCQLHPQYTQYCYLGLTFDCDSNLCGCGECACGTEEGSNHTLP